LQVGADASCIPFQHKNKALDCAVAAAVPVVAHRRFKLGDFGLAIDTTLERSKSRVGTLDYMSPEASIASV